MRRPQLIILVGIIILFVGVITIFYSNSINQIVEIEWGTPYGGIEENTWSISRNFTTGDLITVEFLPAEDWTTPEYFDPSPYPHKPVFVEIINPLGNKTMFYCELVPYAGRLALYHIEVTENNGLLVGVNATVSDEKGVIGAVITDGIHTAKILSAGSPPEAILFFKGEEVMITEYPGSNFLYPSIVMLATGTILTFYGLKISRENKQRRRKTIK